MLSYVSQVHIVNTLTLISVYIRALVNGCIYGEFVRLNVQDFSHLTNIRYLVKLVSCLIIKQK